jgi:hypothetical protein
LKAILLTIGLLAAARLAVAATPASLAAELRTMAEQVREGQVAPALPSQWRVDDPAGAYAISTEPLRKLLDAKATQDAGQWLDRLATHLEGYSTPAPGPNARAALDRILARSEFAGLGPPNPWQVWQRKLQAAIAQWLEKLFGAMGERRAEGAILFWTVIVAAAVAIALWLFGIWRRSRRLTVIPPLDGPAAARASGEWVRTAREAAEAGDWRRAIQCAYWAGVARLEETGALRRDRTRTPREALRAAPARVSEPLAALTSRLERFWYARATAGAEDYAACLRSLETLGCPVD